MGPSMGGGNKEKDARADEKQAVQITSEKKGSALRRQNIRKKEKKKSMSQISGKDMARQGH